MTKKPGKTEKRAKKPPQKGKVPKSVAKGGIEPPDEADKGVAFEEDDYVPDEQLIDEESPVEDESGLCKRVEKFCHEYVIDFNGTRSAIAAGYSPKTAASQASRMLTNVKVQAYLKKIQEEDLDKYGISKEKIMKRMATRAFANLGTFLTINPDTGTGHVDLRKATEEELAGLKEYEVVEMMTGEDSPPVLKTKIKVVDGENALRDLAKRAGLLKEKVHIVDETPGAGDSAGMLEVARRMAFLLAKGEEAARKEAKPA